MATKIYKFPLQLVESQKVSLPSLATVRHIAWQRDTLTMWAEVDPTAYHVEVTVYIVGTGHDIPEGAVTYLGTVPYGEGDSYKFVWHVYMDGTYLV